MRILFITATRIGDAVLSTGLLGHLVDRFPAARFTVAAGPVAAPLFAAVPRLERVLVVEKRGFSLHWLELWASAVRSRWNLVVDLRGSAIAWLLAARERRVMGKGDPREHRVRQLARLFGLDPPPAPRLWTFPEHDAEATALVAPGPPVLALAPTANWPGKEWRPERFAELARRLTGAGGILPGGRVAVLAAAHERPQADKVLAALPRALDLVGRTGLLTAAALLRRAALFVGNDTGLMHVAAASGIPTLGLFGPSPAAQYAPWGRHAAVAQTRLSYEALVTAPDFDHRTTGTLMDTLEVDNAEAAARALWAGRTGAPA